MGIYHFSGLFLLLCIGLCGSLLTSLCEHVFYRLILPCIKRKKKFNYWLHTSQVRAAGAPAPLPLHCLSPTGLGFEAASFCLHRGLMVPTSPFSQGAPSLAVVRTVPGASLAQEQWCWGLSIYC